MKIRLDICELKMADPNKDTADIPNNGKCDTESLEITANADLFMVSNNTNITKLLLSLIIF